MDGCVEASWHFGTRVCPVCLSVQGLWVRRQEAAMYPGLGSFCMEDRLEDGTMTITVQRRDCPPRSTLLAPSLPRWIPLSALKRDMQAQNEYCGTA